MSYRLNSDWTHQDPDHNDHVVDTAGYWTATALINELYKDKEVNLVECFSAGKIRSNFKRSMESGSEKRSCSIEKFWFMVYD